MSIIAPTAAAIAEAAGLLRSGSLVAFPTETVYGLGGDATNDLAVAAIFAAKGRPAFNPLIIHGPNARSFEEAVIMDERAHRLAKRFWPGPLTMVLPRRPGSPVSLLASAGLDSVAVRVPSHPVALALFEAVGIPIAGPSANPSGRISPTTARHVDEGLGQALAMILDGGPCQVGVESTVIDLSTASPTLLRPGGVTLETLREILGDVWVAGADQPNAPRSPGMLSSHYAPNLPVRLNASNVRENEALLAFGRADGATLNLSPTGDLAEAAANLFSMLRSLDRNEFEGIAVMPIPENGLGLAINDRLRRAAAPRA
ncbi:L-threonylcarbamoyladenylate synthase [Telmatospirillum siberiense]|uniref:Threonylcarbamoyl-AMP synthase n=1 Tax=Telmatospirillum siberiense TaxID=382514 RepID=A0A2N3Q094_9PROT|nr:L-threonylcarbamoyladenylate synthase [Telmatospirillum siberiense]PKU26074.1 threonylcarbamoyl-AMP synthase [Telmatospirillum siberiense]